MLRRNSISILLLTILSLALNGQVVFCPPGAEWHAVFNPFNLHPWPVLEVEHVKYSRDSMLNSESVKVLSHKRFYLWGNYYLGNGPSVIRQKGDTIFFRGAVTRHRWEILYNFAAPPGGGWKTALNTGGCGDSLVFQNLVTGETYSVVNGHSLKQKNVKWSCVQSGRTTSGTVKIFERTGADHFPFYYLNSGCYIDGDCLHERLCYQDPQFGLLQLTQNDCVYSVGLTEGGGNDLFSFRPNPAADFVTFKTSLGGFTFVKCFDVLGKPVWERDLDGGAEHQLDISSLSPGVYFFRFYGAGECRSVKMVKRT
jgi:hypothetical protein